jgi:hypothetical protein
MSVVGTWLAFALNLHSVRDIPAQHAISALSALAQPTL